MGSKVKATRKKDQKAIDDALAPYRARNERAIELENARFLMKRYLGLKFRQEDWHGVQDAASDLRDIDSELEGLRY